MVVVNHSLTKGVILAPCSKNIDAASIAQLFLSHVFKCLIPLSLTEVCSSPLHLLGNLHDYFTMMFAFQPPTTLKQMGKPNEPTKKSRPISKSSAPITPRNGQNSLL